MAIIWMPLPDSDFDVTEVAVPWKLLTRAGHRVAFTTEKGGSAPAADPLLLTGVLFGQLGAEPEPKAFYAEMTASPEFRDPGSWSDVEVGAFDGLILPGGHAPGMKQYLGSEALQKKVRAFFETGKPVGAICHGPLVAARAGALEGRKTTCLPAYMERTAFWLTAWLRGRYYRTYPAYVEAEIRAALGPKGEFIRGPTELTKRGTDQDDSATFVVEDANYVSARWPGDAYAFARAFMRKLKSPMRLRVSASSSMPVALVLSRALRITPREALALLREPRVMPADLTADAAASLSESLRALGVTAETIDVPPSSGRCEQHPSLTTDVQCTQCRKSMCVLCQPLCPSCRATFDRANRWKRMRVAVLLAALLGVGGFAFWKHRAREVRHSWLKPLRVSVVLVSTKPVSAAELAAWNDGAEKLQRWFTDEAARLSLRLESPVQVTLAPRVVEADAPSPPSENGEWLDDSRAALEFRARLNALAERGGGHSDVRVVVALREHGAHRVDGVGEAGGSIGLVEGTQGDTKLTLELMAVAHEVLHLVGAHDGYDENGHALPRGIVDPARGFPQRFAEVMVGEIPLSATQGRIPDSLEEVRIGETTAREIGWK